MNHKAEAEQLLKAAENAQPEERDVFLARALVHANLAALAKLDRIDDTIEHMDARVAGIESHLVLNQ